eukprot:965460_1
MRFFQLSQNLPLPSLPSFGYQNQTQTFLAPQQNPKQLCTIFGIRFWEIIESKYMVKPLAHTSQLVVTEDDDEDAKQSEQSKDMEDAQKKPKKPSLYVLQSHRKLKIKRML